MTWRIYLECHYTKKMTPFRLFTRMKQCLSTATLHIPSYITEYYINTQIITHRPGIKPGTPNCTAIVIGLSPHFCTEQDMKPGCTDRPHCAAVIQTLTKTLGPFSSRTYSSVSEQRKLRLVLIAHILFRPRRAFILYARVNSVSHEKYAVCMPRDTIGLFEEQTAEMIVQLHQSSSTQHAAVSQQDVCKNSRSQLLFKGFEIHANMALINIYAN